MSTDSFCTCGDSRTNAKAQENAKFYTGSTTSIVQELYPHLAISMCGNEQWNDPFWDEITMHFNVHVLMSSCHVRSLESKFHMICHDMTKLKGCYAHVDHLNMNGTNREETLEKVLELYNIKVLKNHDFLFMHCWWLLKDTPKWAGGFPRPPSI